jgi:hypothetical protein
MSLLLHSVLCPCTFGVSVGVQLRSSPHMGMTHWLTMQERMSTLSQNHFISLKSYLNPFERAPLVTQEYVQLSDLLLICGRSSVLRG